MRQIASRTLAQPSLRAKANAVRTTQGRKRRGASRQASRVRGTIRPRHSSQSATLLRVSIWRHLVTTDASEPNRRDFLVVAGNAFAAVGAASLLWPFIQQMNPDAGTKALSSIDVDLSPVKEGQAITAMWRGKPIFIRNRT